MGTRFQPLIIPLGRGLDQHSAKNTTKPTGGLLLGTNIDFAKGGGLTGRPGVSKIDGFAMRNYDSGSLLGINNPVNLATLPLTNPRPFQVKDRQGARAGLTTHGRLFTFDDDAAWTDRGGLLAASRRRLGVFSQGHSSLSDLSRYASTYDFGPSDAIASSNVALLDGNGTVEAALPLTGGTSIGPGNGARCAASDVSALAHVVPSTSDVRFVARAAGAFSLTNVSLGGDALTVGAGNAPSICCDHDQSVFFVLYATTTAGQVKLLRVTTAGSVTHTFTLNTGLTGSIKGLWVTNTTTSLNKTAIAVTSTGSVGVLTAVVSSDTLTNQAISLTLDSVSMANHGQVVCGTDVAGSMVLAWVRGTGTLVIGKRSTTAATGSIYLSVPAKAYNTTGQGIYLNIAHQPISMVSSVSGVDRMLLGIVFRRGEGAGQPTTSAAVGTWLVLDITGALSSREPGGGTGNRDPVAVARGDLDTAACPFNPMAAIKVSNTAYRFPTMDWTDTAIGPQSTYDSGTSSTVFTDVGHNAALVLNEVSLINPQAAHAKESTVVAGSCPRMLARGHGHPAGWPLGEAPGLTVTKTSGAPGLLVGVYSLRAVWSWTDDSGQVHRSAPSNVVTVNQTLAQGPLPFTVTSPHLSERETGTVYAEVYCTEAGPSADSPFYLVARLPFDSTLAELSGQVDSINFPGPTLPILYTAGNVLTSQTPDASGGVASVGSRCWVSDGRSVFASKLGSTGSTEAPSWHVDGTLTVDVPAVAGRVVGLQGHEDRLVILCENGVYVTTGEGPDDTGQGPSFMEPVRVSDVSCLEQQTSTRTAEGPVFFARNTAADLREATGGVYILRGTQTTLISSDVETSAALGTAGGNMAYLPERGQVVWYPGTGNNLLVWDMRENAWATWTRGASNPFNHVAAVGGILYSVSGVPMRFTLGQGQDNLGSPENISVLIHLNNIPPGGERFEWARVRSLTMMGDPGAGPYTVVLAAALDDAPAQSKTFAGVSFPASTAQPAWPINRALLEWRLPFQKCSVISPRIEFSPGNLTVTALRLAVNPAGIRPPAPVIG